MKILEKLQVVKIHEGLLAWVDNSTTKGGRIFKRGLILLPSVCILALNLIEGAAKLLMAPVALCLGSKTVAANLAWQLLSSIIVFAFGLGGAVFHKGTKQIAAEEGLVVAPSSYVGVSLNTGA